MKGLKLKKGSDLTDFYRYIDLVIYNKKILYPIIHAI